MKWETRVLPWLTDSVFVLLALYFVLAYTRSLLAFTEPKPYIVSQTFFLLYQLMALALFLVRRRAVAYSRRIRDYVYAIGGLGSPMFFRPIPSDGMLIVAEFLEFMGAVLVAGAFLSLNTSFGIAPENRGIRTGGMYRIVRHPMYLGYILAETGFVLNNLWFFNIFVWGVSVIFLVLRLQAEERLLRNEPAYQTYARKVHWRLIPLIF